MSFGFGFGFPKNYVAALFSPAQLFTGTTQGVWYDPSDITTLYRDAAGTLPVTSVEQPVGLMLDKSKGLVLGSEQAINGSFDTDTGWTKDAGWSIAGGKASASGSAGYFYQSGASAKVIGRTYQITFTISDYVSGTVTPYISGVVSPVSFTSNGTKTVYLRAINTSAEQGFTPSTGASFSIDNISVRELPGNHAFNSSGNSANFPVLSARYNLLTKTEDFGDAVWVQYLSATKSGTSVCTINFGSGTDSAIYQTVPANSVSTQYTYSATVKSSTGKKFRFALYIGGSTVLYSPDIATTANFVTYSYTFPANALTGSPTINIMNESAGGTGQIEVKHPDLRVADDALNQPAYQRVNTATDYDTVGFKPYLRFNGTNQWLQTNSIDFTYTDKMFVCAGVRKLSDAVKYTPVVELSTNAGQNNGAFQIMAPDEPNTYYFRSRGTSLANASSSQTFASPITNVISGIGNISGDQAILRVNGTQAAISIADQGTGNYGNYQMFIGATAGSMFWFNGRLYQMVVAGKQASAAEITSTETYINQKTGAF